jgi:hypothetical protein
MRVLFVCVERGRRREDWDLPDPKPLDEAGVRAVRDEIETRVRKLLANQ